MPLKYKGPHLFTLKEITEVVHIKRFCFVHGKDLVLLNQSFIYSDGISFQLGFAYMCSNKIHTILLKFYFYFVQQVQLTWVPTRLCRRLTQRSPVD